MTDLELPKEKQNILSQQTDLKNANIDITYWHHEQRNDDSKAMKNKSQGNGVLHPDGLSERDMETIINHVLGSPGISSVPRRFAMGDMVAIDEDGMTALETSPEWGVQLPHIRRSILAEKSLPAAMVRFVPRMTRSRPQVAYAVRYWKGLNDKPSLTAALEEVRAAWLVCQQPEPGRLNSTHSTENIVHEPAAAFRSKQDNDAGHSSTPFCSGNVGHEINSPGADGEPIDIRQEAPQCPEKSAQLCPRNDAPIVTMEACEGHPKSGKDSGSQSEKTGTALRDDTTRVSSLPPEIDDSRATAPSKKRRGSPMLEVLGFAADWDLSLRQGCVALIGEWPGIGSLQDLLEGKIGMRRASQEDLIRWTRQVAEGLVRVCGSDGIARVAGAGATWLLRVSTRNVYLFPRPKSEFSLGSAEFLDARVATFLGPSFENNPSPVQGENNAAYKDRFVRPLMPPEWVSARFDDNVLPIGCTPSSPAKTNAWQTRRKCVDVWGMGTLVFELATARIAGPMPLALRPLRDLLRDVPIGPRFLYGDLARGVMRLAFRTDPGERAGAPQIAAIVEEITARTLRRAHTASDRQARLLRAEHRAAGLTEGSAGEHTNDTGDDASDGYGQALREWNIKQAIERARGRARVFLRQLWFDSLSEDKKRRVRHKRRQRKANKMVEESRRRRVKAAVMRHWTPVEVAAWIERVLRKAEGRGNLPLLFSGGATGRIGMMVDGHNSNDQHRKFLLGGEQILRGLPAVVSNRSSDISNELVGGKPKDLGRNTDAASVILEDVVSGVGVHESEDRLSNVGNGRLFNRVGDQQQDDGWDGEMNNQNIRVDNADTADELRASAEEGSSSGDDDHDWASVEATERKGYSGVAVEPAAVAKGMDGFSLLEAMEGALKYTEDALTRFVKSSVRLPRLEEVESRRVELMVRELVTLRPYSNPSQIKMRALLGAIVRIAEAPHNLVEEEIDAQIWALARVLTAGYRRQAAFAEEGKHLAAARVQGLARGAQARNLISSIWRQAEEFAADVIRGERETRSRAEAERRVREKEKAIVREREEAERYRLRLVPSVSSVRCRSMEVSLPSFLVEAARGSRRFFVMKISVSYSTSTPSGRSPPEDTWSGEESNADRIGRIRVLLRQGFVAELKTSTQDSSPIAIGTNLGHGVEAEDAVHHTDRDVSICDVGDIALVSMLSPSTTYRLTLELSPNVRSDLLQSARALGLSTAIRSLEGAAALAVHAANGGEGSTPKEAALLNSAHVDVVTLPDVPGVPRVVCKVLTSASAVDPRDPGGVLSLRQWQSPYPGIADMDGPCSRESMLLAPGRPEALVSLRWTAPEDNGLNICRYDVERRVGPAGSAWKKVITRGGGGSGNGRGAKTALPLVDAMDAPLRTIAFDVLKDVAVRGLPLGYRVVAQNMLGAGNPSPAVEVSLHAFLGHLRAHARAEHRDALPATSSLTLVNTPPHSFPPSSVEFLNTSASATFTADAVAANSHAQFINVVSCSEQQVKPAATSGISKAIQQQHQHQQPKQMPGPIHMEPPPSKAAAAQKSGPVVETNTGATAQEEAFFGDDFLGLRSYGEERVHSLFNLGAVSTSTLRRAPAAERDVDHTTGSAPAEPSFTEPLPSSQLFLPPIVDSGVSGEKRPMKRGYIKGKKNSDESALVGRSPDGGIEGESNDRLMYGVDQAAVGLQSSRNNEVFHAFLNVGERLPGRLRRDRRGGVLQ